MLHICLVRNILRAQKHAPQIHWHHNQHSRFSSNGIKRNENKHNKCVCICECARALERVCTPDWRGRQEKNGCSFANRQLVLWLFSWLSKQTNIPIQSTKNLIKMKHRRKIAILFYFSFTHWMLSMLLVWLLMLLLCIFCKLVSMWCDVVAKLINIIKCLDPVTSNHI